MIYLLDIVGDHERVIFPRRLEDVAAFLGHPVVFQIAPTSLSTRPCTACGWRWRLSTPDLRTLRRFIQYPCDRLRQSGRKRHVLALRHPDALVDGDCVRDDEVRQRLLWHRILGRAYGDWVSIFIGGICGS